MAFLARRAIILAEIETTYATDPTPTGSANAILVQNLSRQIYEGARIKRNLNLPYLGNDFEYNTGAFVTVSFEVELVGGSAAGTAPHFGPLLQACAMGETVSAGVSVTYAPVSETFKSVTIYYNLDGQNQVIVGARGNCVLNFQRGQIPKLQFTFTGIYARPTAVSLPSPTYTTITPRPMNKANTDVEVHSQAVYCSAFSLNLGVSAVYRNLTDYEAIDVVDREPTGSVVFEKLPIATKNYYAALESHTSNITTDDLVVTHGPASGSGGNFAMTLGKVQLNALSESEEDGIVMDNFSVIPVPTSGNDEISIVFA